MRKPIEGIKDDKYPFLGDFTSCKFKGGEKELYQSVAFRYSDELVYIIHLHFF